MALNLMRLWQRLSSLPAGTWLFSYLLAWKVPYSGSIGARVVELKPGYACVSLNDRRKIRNHLNSIHAIALSNFGELAGGLALNAALPAQVRAIVIKITTEYLKKARGQLVCQSEVSVADLTGRMDVTVQAVIKDQHGDIVAKTFVLWRLSAIE